MWSEFNERVSGLGVLPVAIIEHASDVLPLVDALSEGGLPAIEITFRTEAAADAIAAVSADRPEVLVGAGTVLTCEQVDAAVESGAEFVVSPGFDIEVVRRCIQLDVPVVPGAVTPTEIICARNLGINLTKFFPAGHFGGINTITSLAAPFSGHMFMPTGGVSARNLGEYLSNPHVSSCGGTWLANKNLIGCGNYDEICRLCHEAVEIVNKTRNSTSRDV